jgi:riboflavin biosynthesis pyrimidine reductase
MPAELERIYGSLGFGKRVVYSNFVASLDGVTSLGDTPSAGSVISGRNPADRFLLALLRACADGVLVGAGTLRATPGHHWTPQHTFPALADEFAALRKSLGLKPDPRLVVLTRSGNIDPRHPAFADGATVVTPRRGVLERLPRGTDLIATDDLGTALDELRSRGFEVLLTEGGPHVMGELVAGGMLDEVFLTVSPVVAGRDQDTRLGMVAGVELLPDRGVWGRLLSLRRQGDYLFLRYVLPARGEDGEARC